MRASVLIVFISHVIHAHYEIIKILSDLKAFQGLEPQWQGREGTANGQPESCLTLRQVL